MLLPDGDPEAAIESIGADVEDAEVTQVEADSQPTELADAKPETPTPAVPRDERGRFTDKASTPAAQASPEAGTPAETPVEPTAPEAEAPGEPVYPPSTYRADGQEFSILGSAVGEDGHFIPTDVWQREVLPLLAAGRAARGGSLQKHMQNQSRELVQSKTETQAAQAQTRVIMAKVQELVERGTWGEWAENAAQNLPVLFAQAEAEALRVQQQAQARQIQELQAERQQQELEPQFSQALEQSLLSFGQQAGLDQAQLAGLYQQLNAPAMRNTLFVRAPFDDPMTGLRAGDWAINNEIVQQWVQWAGQYQPKASLPPKVAHAQAQNAKRTAASPPPVVGGKGGAAPSGKPKPPKYKDGQEALKRIFDDEEFINFEVVE